MKKISKLMTVAGCALVIGGGLSLYAATRSTGDIQPLADETTYPVAILYKQSGDFTFAYNGGVATDGFRQGDHNIVFGYDPATKTAKNFKDKNADISGAITVTKAGDSSYNLTLDNLNLNWSYIISEGWLNDGMAILISYNGWWGSFEPGEYTFNIPAGLVQFTDDTWNDAATLTFSIVGSMNATWTVDSEYIPAVDVENGITFTFEDATTVEVADLTQTFQYNNQSYQGTQLKIKDNQVTLPGIDVEDGTNLQISFPAGYFKGSNGSANYLSNAVSTRYKVWGGMPATATCLTQFPSFVTEWGDLVLQWRGQAVTLPGGALDGKIEVEFDGAASGTYELNCEIVPSDQEGTNNLVIKELTGQIVSSAGYFSTLTVSLPQGVVENAQGQINLPQQVASFNFVRQYNVAMIETSITNQGSTVSAVFEAANEQVDIQMLNLTDGVYPMIDILDGENVVASLSKSDLKQYEWPAEEQGFTFDMNDIKGLLPNKEYTLRLNPFAVNVFIIYEGSNYWYLYNPVTTAPIKNEVVIQEQNQGALGKGTLSPLKKYTGVSYNQPVTSFVVLWENDGDNLPVKIFDPSQISGTVKGFEIKGLTVEAAQVSDHDYDTGVTTYTYGVQVNIPTAYQSNYGEFNITLGQNLVYDTEGKTNAETNVIFNTYGSIPQSITLDDEEKTTIDYMIVSPTPGTYKSEDLSTIEIEWTGFIPEDEEVTSVVLGEAPVKYSIGTSGEYNDIPKDYVSVNDENKLVINLSYLNLENTSYSFSLPAGAVVVTTDVLDEYINAIGTFSYTVWDGMEAATVTGPSGPMSLDTALSEEGVYTLTWGVNVKPSTKGVEVKYEGYNGGMPPTGTVSQDLMTFLDVDGNETAWEDGGYYLRINAKSIIEDNLTTYECSSTQLAITTGSVYGSNNPNAINPNQTFGQIEIKELAKEKATITKPVDGVISIYWTKGTYWVASTSNGPSLQLLDDKDNLIEEFSFQTAEYKSPVVTIDPESPLQFMLENPTADAKYAYGFELDLNELGLPYGDNDYKLVLPEGWLYVVESKEINTEGYFPPINAPQTLEFSFARYDVYEGKVQISPESGDEVVELNVVTVTFTDAKVINSVDQVIVNGNELEEGITYEGNVLTIVPGVVDAEEVTIFIPEGSIVIDDTLINGDIEAAYTFKSEGIAGIYAEDGRYEVYTVAGVHVLSTENASALNNLENGLYIINGKKVYIRK